MRVDSAKVRRAGALLQEIEDEMIAAGRQNESIEPKLRFPRGFIQSADLFRRRFPCRLRTIGNNVAYTLQFQDVLRWILNRTDLDITAKEMVIKFGIVSMVSVIEGLVHDALSASGLKNPPKKLKAAIDRLEKLGLITPKLAANLQEVRRKRERVHLQLYEIDGPEGYEVDDWNLASERLVELATQLRDRHRRNEA